MSTPTFVTDNLDRLEKALPPVPARVLRLQRTIAGSVCDQVGSARDAFADSTRSFLQTARVSGKTVTGQTRSAAEDVVDRARTGARTVAGQARAATQDVAGSARTGARTVAGQSSAQGRRVAASARRETTDLLDSAIDAVDTDTTSTSSGSGRRYEQWTKAELLERAKELEIEGRYGMSKGELIKALRAS